MINKNDVAIYVDSDVQVPLFGPGEPIADPTFNVGINGPAGFVINPPTVTIAAVPSADRTSVELTATGTDDDLYNQDPTFLWSTGETTAVINVTMGDSYQVTITDQGGAQATATEIISVNTAPFVALSDNGVTTEGEDLVLTYSALELDPDGTLTSWILEHIRPDGTTVTLASDTEEAVNATFEDTLDDTYNGENTFRLTATDNHGAVTIESLVKTYAPNVRTLTINFVDNTGVGATLSSVAQYTLTAEPGTAISVPNRTVIVNSNYVLNSASCAEEGDSADNITCNATLVNSEEYLMQVSGTVPDEDTTVTLTISADTTELIVRPMTMTRTATPSGTSGNSSRQASYSFTWDGGGTATFTANTGFGAQDGGAFIQIPQDGSGTSSTHTGGSGSSSVRWQNVIATTVQSQGIAYVSVPADGTYRATTIQLGATGASTAEVP